MDDIKSHFQCTSCRRGVLSRSAEKCLFCGAVLPTEVRLSSQEIATRESMDELTREKSRREWIQPHPESKSKDLDGLGDAIDWLGDF